jgi:signal transduction histidine kinase
VTGRSYMLRIGAGRPPAIAVTPRRRNAALALLLACALLLAALVAAPDVAPVVPVVWASLAIAPAVLRHRGTQIALHVLFGGLYVAVLVALAEPAVDIALQLALYAVVAGFGHIMASSLRHAIASTGAAGQQAERRTALIAGIARINRLDLDELLPSVCETALSLGFDVALIGGIEPDGGVRLWAARGDGADTAGLYPTTVLAREGAAGLVVEAGGTVVLDDYAASDHALSHLRGSALHGTVGTIVHAGGQPVAVLLAASARPGTPAAWQVEVIEDLAIEAGRALDNINEFMTAQATAGALTDIDRLKGEFVSSVSHELRTPLTVIRGLSETLTSRGDELAMDVRVDLLARINDNTRRLDRLIGSLLEYSRIQRGEVEVHSATFEVARLVTAVRGRVEPAMPDHALSVALPDADARVEGDPLLLGQVLECLLANAMTHTPAGTSVRMDVRVADTAVEFSVEDDGPGIAPEDVPHLTERFYRGAGWMVGTHEGLGLGLATAQRILEVHGATLQITSSPGCGARFAFRLPLAG